MEINQFMMYIKLLVNNIFKIKKHEKFHSCYYAIIFKINSLNKLLDGC